MASLPQLLGAFLGILEAHSLCKKVVVLETKEFSTDQYFIKIRAEIAKGYKLQIRIYYNYGHVDYAYQLFTELPILRWDNKEEFSDLASYPHHFHAIDGYIKNSPLSGDPLKDISIVLQYLKSYINSLHA
jgi:hypothetical protein